MGWFHQVKNPKLKNLKKSLSHTPEGLWKKCTHCGEIVQTEKMEENFNVCPYCSQHYRLSAQDRLALLVDENTFTEYASELMTTDPLKFTDKIPYGGRLEQAYKTTGVKDGTVCGIGEMNGMKVAMAVMDFRFMGGSMGVVTGEKIAMAMDLAYEQKIPCLVITCSGGARMQEGILSLMQMAKTSASRARLKEHSIPYISLLTDPTTGGCAASFAVQGDVNLAEPRALIGFAGPRVIEQSIRQTLPEGFQRAEFLLEHGFIDQIIHRKDLKQEIFFILKCFTTLAMQLNEFNLEAWLIHHAGNEIFTPGLNRVADFLKPETDYIQSYGPRLITIAGTNGKGECAYTLAHLLKNDGCGFALWTSPHILSINERFESESGPLSASRLLSYFQEVEKREEEKKVRLSFYEFLWAAFLFWARDTRPDYLLLEVGLGGRLDAVNIFPADLVCLTSISRDHQEILGNRYDQILSEKLGVVREGKKLVSSLELAYLREKTHMLLEDKKVEWIDLFAKGELKKTDFFGRRNRVLAAYALTQLQSAPEFNTALYEKRLKEISTITSFRARGEKLMLGESEFTFFGSHNADGVRKLIHFLENDFYNSKRTSWNEIWVSFTRRSPKDIKAMLGSFLCLKKYSEQMVVTEFDHPRALPLKEWPLDQEKSDYKISSSISQLVQGLDEKRHQKILVTGSYYFVADVQNRLLKRGGTLLPHHPGRR